MMAPGDFRLVFFDAATYGDISLKPFAAAWACTIHPHSTPAEVRQRLEGKQAAIVNKVRLDRALLSSAEAKALKLIAVAATGTDNVDLEAASARGIVVCNVPRYATQSVAQFTLALILELATGAGRNLERVRGGEWQKSPVFTLLDYPSTELANKTLGIVGFGSIGQAVAAMAQSFGMKILISARPGTTAPAPPGRTPFTEVLKRSDVVTLHCPLAPNTKSLIDRQALSLMKPTALLVNTARGGLIDDAALIEALESGELAGAALDVLSLEPPPADHPIIQAVPRLKNLIVTPHCAWSARESRQRLLDEVAENIAAFLRGEPRNRVA
jgi:glycerate dehydrogenase